jgi:hypothetical protein
MLGLTEEIGNTKKVKVFALSTNTQQAIGAARFIDV